MRICLLFLLWWIIPSSPDKNLKEKLEYDFNTNQVFERHYDDKTRTMIDKSYRGIIYLHNTPNYNYCLIIVNSKFYLYDFDGLDY